MAIPEQQYWEYPNGYNYVCSSFAAALWKAAGLFEGFEIVPQEITPRDIFLLNFLENDPDKRPQACKDQDPTLPYCQITGVYQVILPEGELGSLAPYDHMFE